MLWFQLQLQQEAWGNSKQELWDMILAVWLMLIPGVKTSACRLLVWAHGIGGDRPSDELMCINSENFLVYDSWTKRAHFFTFSPKHCQIPRVHNSLGKAEHMKSQLCLFEVALRVFSLLNASDQGLSGFSCAFTFIQLIIFTFIHFIFLSVTFLAGYDF